jgi:hypothetical protein
MPAPDADPCSCPACAIAAAAASNIAGVVNWIIRVNRIALLRCIKRLY